MDLLKGDLKSLRSMVTCKVCFKLLYEPYTLGCGHTFCYSVGSPKGPPWDEREVLTPVSVSLFVVRDEEPAEDMSHLPRSDQESAGTGLLGESTFPRCGVPRWS